MEKKLNKPYSRNVRLDKPCGLLGVPPDAFNLFPAVRGRQVIIVTDEYQLGRWLGWRRGTDVPQ